MTIMEKMAIIHEKASVCAGSRFTVHCKYEPWGGSILLTKSDGKALAHIYWYDDDDYSSIYISGLFVSPESRRYTFGTELMGIFEDIGRSLNSKYAYLAVQKRVWMRDWYKRIGYEEFEYNDVEDEPDAIWMRKSIT